MGKTVVAFPVPNRMEDINKLAMLLNDAGLSGDWHFVNGSRFDQERIDVEFNSPADGVSASLRYRQAQGSTGPSPR